MKDPTKQVSKNLGKNLIYLRQKKRFSQSRLAELAGIPRTTLTHIESGLGNPSLTNLVKLSSALGVGIEELLTAPRAEAQLFRECDLTKSERGRGRIKVINLLPDSYKGMAIERMEFEPNSSMGGHPHLPGSKEYMTVVKGEVTVHVSGDRFDVKKGQVLAFPGHQHHSYGNLKSTAAVAISVIIPVPATSL